MFSVGSPSLPFTICEAVLAAVETSNQHYITNLPTWSVGGAARATEPGFAALKHGSTPDQMLL